MPLRFRSSTYLDMTRIYNAVPWPSSFVWEAEQTPLASTKVPLFACFTYLTTVAVLKLYVQKPIGLPKVVAAFHNFNLTALSILMFVGAAWEILKESQKRNSLTWLVCLPEKTKVQGPLYFWSYVYYLSKFYEFLDTFLLIIKAKPLTFLHVFHHAAVVPMAYFWLADAQSLQQIALLTNTGIHVIMYSYYLLCSLGQGPNWKRLITNAQILQFVFSFAISIPFWWQHALGKRCSGFRAMLFNAAFNLILLALFVNFYRRTYKAKTKKES